MKALSIRQPWAWLIVNGHKDIENRTWRTSFRGRVLIHASKGMTRQEYEDVQDYLYALCLNAQAFDGDGPIRLPSFDQLARGGIVGVATVTDCLHFENGDSPWHMPECWGFRIAAAKPLPFTECKGALGFFDIPADVAAILRARATGESNAD
ncbi:ASCH domain-containing protein [Ensifer sp. SSB1]|jgi:hypothetical protein|uniref:ASCH domain-containing protein n=1 Tax=Ensifer sp. SSB1 TaxID=2795385 RepID=UPI001A60C2F4|nr:ASCH domain-containing protein [Ensifer sp. SSB1]MBK5570115.1 ASCH domain-containing protein [Ensifer sp. SSB1]